MGFYLVKKVIQQMINNGIEIKKCTVGLMGITFKENCPDFRNSKIIDVFNELKNWGANVVVVDPWVDQEKLQKELQIKLGKIDENNKVDSLIVAVGHDQFRSLSAIELKSFCNGSKPVIGDVKSIYNKQELIKEGFSVFRL